MKKLALIALCLLILPPGAAYAQDAAADGKQDQTTAQQDTQTAAPATQEDASAVYLDPVETSAPKDTITRVHKSDMDLFDARDLVDAIKNTPGITYGVSGMRNEKTIMVRGFKQSQVPIYLNGMPIYTPYDGYAEIGMLQTFDLESVEISKGYTSALMGANNMGGAINMRMAKPKKKFEFEARYINDFDRKFDDQGRIATMSIGTKQEKFYLRANGLYKRQDHFRMSHEYDSSFLQDDGKRRNSESQDKKISIIAGVTPTKDIDIYLTYTKQKSEKEQPIEVRQVMKKGFRTWSWPQWDKESVMLNGDFNLSPKAYIKTMLFYDSYNNKMNDYKNSGGTRSYLEMGDLNTQSKYHDFSYGGRIEGGYTFNEMHKIAISGSYKHDRHRRIESDYQGGNKGPQYDNWSTGQYEDDLWSFGAEYTLTPVKPLTLVFGTTFSILDPRSAQNFGWNRQSSSKPWEFQQIENIYPRGDTTAWDYQLGIFYDVTEKHQVYGTFAKKTRFATLKERYTSGFDGSKLPNPDLSPEEAYNWELGYRGTIADMFKVTASVFYSDVKDLINSEKTGVVIQTSSTTSTDQTQNRNINKVHLYGYELGVEAYLNEYVSLGANYSYLKSENRSGDDRDLTNRPEHSASAYAVVTPVKGLNLVPRVEYLGTSNTTIIKAGQSEYAKTDSFFLAHFKASYDVTENFSVEAGVQNLFDEYYEPSYGFPAQGRTFFTGAKITF